MAIIGALPITLQNGTLADATQVMADFNSIKTDVNANAAANGANSDITSLAGLTTPLSVPQGGSGSAAPAPFTFTGGYRNIARRNGGLEIWQRGAGGAASMAVVASTLSGAYTADGWYLVTNVNQASVVSQQAGIVDGSQFSANVLRNNGQTGTGAQQFGFPLDYSEIYPMLGKFVRLSFTAKAGVNWSPASGTLVARLYVGTGAPAKQISGYTSETIATSATLHLTTTATRYQNSSSAIIPTTTRQAEIRFSWTPVGTAGADDSFYIDDVQLEIVPAATGYTASDFERLNFIETLLLCQRHFWKSFLYGTAPATNVGVGTGEVVFMAANTNGIVVFTKFQLATLMRVAPTGTIYNPSAANNALRNTTTATDLTSNSIVTTINTVQLIGTTPAATAAHHPIAGHVTLDAGI